MGKPARRTSSSSPPETTSMSQLSRSRSRTSAPHRNAFPA